MERIVVGVDGSEAAQDALRWAVAEAQARGARLAIVHAWQYPYFGPTPIAGMVVDLDDLEASARGVLEHAAAEVDLTGLAEPAELVLVDRTAAIALVEAAKGADLLVVGTRGRGGFKGLLLGSVSQQLTHHAPCPIVIVPHRV